MTPSKKNKQQTGVNEDGGFTLIEVLAALAIFSVAAIGILQASSTNAAAINRIQTKVIARIVADNRINETLVQQQELELGSSGGVVEMADLKWKWSQTISQTSSVDVLQIRVVVKQATSPPRGEQNIANFDAEVSAYEILP